MGVILDEALPVLNVKKQYYLIFLEIVIIEKPAVGLQHSFLRS